MGSFKEISARYTLAWLGFLGVLTVYFCRLNLSIGIVAMVRQKRATLSGSNISICPSTTSQNWSNLGSSTDEDHSGEFDWDPGAQGDLLASYYYGYIFTQAIGPILATRVGYKRVWGFAMILSGVLTVITPQMAWTGYVWMFATRILVGFCHGVTFPAMHGLIGIWSPPSERSRLVSIYISGASVGTCILFPIGGLIISQFGWPFLFYFTGVVSFFWSILWFCLAYDSPQKHPWMTQEERDLIENSLKEDMAKNEARNVPWRSILTSKPVWAVAAGHLASNWGNYQLNSLLPTYLATVLQFDVKSNGLISSMPFIAQAVICVFGGWITDLLIKRGHLRTITARKVDTGLGLLVPALTVVLAGYMGCRAWLAVMFFIISVGFNSFTVPGCKTGPLDFAPRHAGAIFAVTNTVANLSGFLAPQTTGHLLNVENSLENWQLAFWISAMVYVPGFIIFQIWGSDQLQSWN